MIDKISLDYLGKIRDKIWSRKEYGNVGLMIVFGDSPVLVRYWYLPLNPLPFFKNFFIPINAIVNLSPIQDRVKKFFNSENIGYVSPLPGFIPIASVNQGLCQDSFRQCPFEVM